MGMDQNLKMKISNSSTWAGATFQWPTLVPEPMALNFSSASRKPLGLMENMLCLEKLLEDLTSLILLRMSSVMDLRIPTPWKLCKLSTVVNSPKKMLKTLKKPTKKLRKLKSQLSPQNEKRSKEEICEYKVREVHIRM